jgi:hypothetical protein
MNISTGHFDLGYWDDEKSCSICNQIDHYTRNCPHKNGPKKTFNALVKGQLVGTYEGRHRHEAWAECCYQHRKSNWYGDNWHKIEMVEVLDREEQIRLKSHIKQMIGNEPDETY